MSSGPGDGEERVVADWAVIRNQSDARAFVAAMTAAPRSFLGRDRDRRGDRFFLRAVCRERL
jgi:hypothetical protein